MTIIVTLQLLYYRIAIYDISLYELEHRKINFYIKINIDFNVLNLHLAVKLFITEILLSPTYLTVSIRVPRAVFTFTTPIANIRAGRKSECL